MLDGKGDKQAVVKDKRDIVNAQLRSGGHTQCDRTFWENDALDDWEDLERSAIESPLDTPIHKRHAIDHFLDRVHVDALLVF